MRLVSALDSFAKEYGTGKRSSAIQRMKYIQAVADPFDQHAILIKALPKQAVLTVGFLSEYQTKLLNGGLINYSSKREAVLNR